MKVIGSRSRSQEPTTCDFSVLIDVESLFSPVNEVW